MNMQEKYMQRCIDISKQGISLASPNPSVGAVLVFENKIIGEGFTAAFGGAHAEVNCINSVSKANKHKIKNATLYVSLEPCSHQGKTPACSLLIIEKGIQKVVVGSLDPNPLVAGNGIKMLQDNGIEVEIDVLKEACRFSNRRFYIFHTKKRPFVILKWAQTKNGYFSPINNEQFWITNKFSKQLVHKWRTEEMAILVGTNTAKIDNPRLNARLYKGKNPLRLVIDKNLNLDNSLHLFDRSIPSVIFNNIKNEKSNNLEFVKLNFEKDISIQILDFLYQNNINSVIIEGGVKTLESFIENNLWDEARILTGNTELKEGKKAPKILAKEIEEINLKGDFIKIISNNNKL